MIAPRAENHYKLTADFTVFFYNLFVFSQWQFILYIFIIEAVLFPLSIHIKSLRNFNINSITFLVSKIYSTAQIRTVIG